MEKKRKKHPVLLGFLCVLVLCAAAVGMYMHFGGFGTGECADVREFEKYAVPVSDLTVPESARVVALGEATHGNREFQELRLEVFQVLVEQYGVRAFGLEGDFGGCEAVNRYIHGGEGTAGEALAAMGFAIYRTGEMENLVEWMRSYNAAAPEGGDLRFYGFDMEQYASSCRYLLEAMEEAGMDTAGLEAIWNKETGTYADSADSGRRAEVLRGIQEALPAGHAQAAQFAEVLLQNIELGDYLNDSGEFNAQRDRMMAENVQWILYQEQSRGNDRIFISGHNNHVMQCPNAGSQVMGSRLAKELGDGYFVIGTDFYRSVCNLPKPLTGKRITHTFYSYDPLAKASRKCGFDKSYLDFSRIPEDSALTEQVEGSIWMGSLGEAYSVLMNVVPRSYRVLRTPKDAYDAMIFVAKARPIEIRK